MAGLLHGYTSPGKGVRKDEKKKKGFALFIELLTRKLWSYVLLNVIFAITALPSIYILWGNITGTYGNLLELIGNTDAFHGWAFYSLIIAIFITCIFSLSPLASGYYYILRRYADEEHAWVIGDFFGKFKENWKKSIIIYLVDLILINVCVFSMGMYIRMLSMGNYIIAIITVFIIALIIYAVMVPYKWIQLVTIDLKLKDLYKNSFYMVLGVLRATFTYILASACYGCVIYMIFRGLSPLYGILFMILIGFALYGLIQAIALYPSIKKHIVEPAKKEYYSEED